jgi:hypothetical protein
LCRYRLATEALVELDAPATVPGRVDEIAEALGQAAAAGDAVAARVLLQHMLPSLVVVAWGGGFGGGVRAGEECDAPDTMISTVWLSLATGEALRGRAGVRRRLLRDAEYRVLQRPRRRKAREELAAARSAATACAVSDITGRPESVGIPAGEELLEVVLEALDAGLTLGDARLLAMLGVAGLSATDAARLDPAHVSSRCVRYRRAAALRRIRSLIAEAA